MFFWSLEKLGVSRLAGKQTPRNNIIKRPFWRGSDIKGWHWVSAACLECSWGYRQTLMRICRNWDRVVRESLQVTTKFMGYNEYSQGRKIQEINTEKARILGTELREKSLFVWQRGRSNQPEPVNS